MKSNRARIIACLLACAIGVACGACGKENNEKNGSNTTIASEELAKMQKQNMTFQFAMSDDEINDGTSSEGVPVNEGVSSENSTGNSDESSYITVTVTDDAGQPVTDANGNTVTEIVTGGDSNSNQSSQGNNSNGNTTGNNDGNSSGEGTDDYQPNIVSFQAYWLDMSSGKDVVCNGDFLDVTFKIKEDAPDGNYALMEGANDFANWDAEHVPVSYVAGDIAVGNATQKEEGTPQSGTFTITAGTAKGNPGDEVTVRFNMSDNPGIVALIFRFKYDANALEVVDAVVGSDCSDYIQMSV